MVRSPIPALGVDDFFFAFVLWFVTKGAALQSDAKCISAGDLPDRRN
jgi:hypothetical protein